MFNKNNETIFKLIEEGYRTSFMSFDSNGNITGIHMENNDFEDLELEITEFTGDNPRPIISDAYSYSYDIKNSRHFAKTSLTHDITSIIYITDTYWSEIPKEEANFYSMTLLSDGQWCFSPCVPNLID